MGSVDICIFTECPRMRLFSSLPTPPFHHLAGFYRPSLILKCLDAQAPSSLDATKAEKLE